MTGTLLYDADCGFCTRSADWLARRARGVAVMPMQSVDLAARRVDEARATKEVPFVAADGQVRWGADAIAAVLRSCPAPLRQAGWLIERPPVAWLARPVYALVARYRHRLPGGTTSCRLPR